MKAADLKLDHVSVAAGLIADSPAATTDSEGPVRGSEK